MSEDEKINFPEEFVEYAKKKLAEDGEYIKRTAEFGTPVLKGIALLIIDAAGEKCEG